MTLRSPTRRSLLAGMAAFALVPSQAMAEIKKIPRDHGPTTMQVVQFPNDYRPGTIVISNSDRTLHRLLGNGRAERFQISVGREGFSWTGQTTVGRKATWPSWHPPAEMRKRDPSLPPAVPPGPYNPLGARALYLYSNGRDTLYRIHGTNSAGTIGAFETSGCFRLTNTDVMYLYQKVEPGTLVVVK